MKYEEGMCWEEYFTWGVFGAVMDIQEMSWRTNSYCYTPFMKRCVLLFRAFNADEQKQPGTARHLQCSDLDGEWNHSFVVLEVQHYFWGVEHMYSED